MIETIRWNGADIDVHFTYYPARPGRISGPPEDCYPDEPSELEIEQIVYNSVNVTNLFSDDDLIEITAIIERLLESEDE